MDHSLRRLHKELSQADSYAAWSAIAREIDRVGGGEDWKEDDDSQDFDCELIRSRLQQVRWLRQTGERAKLVHHLRQGLHWNLGNTGNPALYQHCLFGTKRVVHEYIQEIASALDELCDVDAPDFDHPARLRFFSDLDRSYGRSALMLSGGASLGLFHVGVVKALFREGLLPTVLSGSSAGSIVCATVGSRGPDEVETLLDPEAAYYYFWRMLKPGEMIRRRALMDQEQLQHAIAANVADLTFEEAYAKSGRAINITVSPASANQPPRLLNYLTFPYLYLREAVLASCAVPLLFPPVMLMTQSEDHHRVPYMPQLRWNDGSLKSDLPILRTRRLHNVNHFIVSQTNPHVLPFVTHHEPGEGGMVDSARHYLLDTARTQAKSLLDLVRRNAPFGVMRHTLDVGASVLDQHYRGNVTILPDVSLWRYANVTRNPNMKSVQRFMLEGERATWPRMEMIRNQTLISRTLENCLARLQNEPVRLAVTAKARNKPALRVVERRG